MGNTVLTSTPSPINLNYVLVVPQLKKNLLPVSQLTKGNSCTFKFSSSNFKRKDRKTGKTLATGSKNGDFYSLDLPKSAFFIRY